MKRLRRFVLLFAISMLTVAPGATILVLAAFTERTVKNPDEERFKCYGCVVELTMVSSDEGWAAGGTVSGKGTLYHYDGTIWRVMDSVPNVHITRITMLSASAGWARRYIDTDSNEESVLLRFEDGVWTRVAIPEDISLYALSSLTPGDVWLVGATRTNDQDGYVHGVLLRYLDGNWQTFAIPRQRSTTSDTIPLHYLFDAMLGAYVLPLSVWLISFARQRAQRPIFNKKARKVFIVWFVTLLGFSGALAAASFFATELLDAVPWYIVAGGLALLVSFPTVYLALPLFFPSEDDSARWRRQT